MSALFYVKPPSGYGSGYGDGNGNGDGGGTGYGSGSGSGSGTGSGTGYGNGYGSGNGYGYGDGSGNGDGGGDGSGDGDGDGTGYGSGTGDGDVKSISTDTIDYIDGVPTIIKSHRGSLAKGFIVNLADFTETQTWVAKQGHTYAHGDTARGAVKALEEKLIAQMSVEERIAEFLRIGHSPRKKYPVRHFFDWHGKLTGSCESGRMAFAKAHGLDLDQDTLTVTEFIALTKGAYGSDVIARLAEQK